MLKAVSTDLGFGILLCDERDRVVVELSRNDAVRLIGELSQCVALYEVERMRETVRFRVENEVAPYGGW